MKSYVYPAATSTARALIRYIIDMMNREPERIFYLAFSGGTTPSLMFDIWAHEFREETPWMRMRIFWVDERCVSVSDSDSNYGTMLRLLLQEVGMPDEYVYPIHGDCMEIISQNARIPFKDVAAECGVSRAAIHQRVQRLIDLGVIVGSGYHVNPKSLGYRTCTYVGIKLEKGSMYKAVVAEMQKIPEIVECHFTTGPYTMLTKVYARDNEHLMDLLNNKMQEIPGVTATETLISLEQSIKKEIPICPEK